MHNSWRLCGSRQTSVLTDMIQKDLPILSLSRWSCRTHMGIASPLIHWGTGEHLAVLDHRTKSIFLLSITCWDRGSMEASHSEIGGLCSDEMWTWWDVELESKLGIAVRRQHYQGSWRSLSSFIYLANAQKTTPYYTVQLYI